MFLPRICLFLLFHCVFCELFLSDPEDDVKTVNIWSISNTRRSLKSNSTKKKHGRAHSNKKVMRGIKNEVLDFFDCLREGKGDYYDKIITCLAQDNDIPKMKHSASEALKTASTEQETVVYKCFANMETKTDNKKHNAAQLMKCLTRPNVEKAIKNMSLAKSEVQILATFQNCMAHSNKTSYEGKVLFCMDNPHYFDKDLLKYVRMNNYKMNYINKGYNDKWGIKMKFNSTILLDSKETVKGKRKSFDSYNYVTDLDPSLNAVSNKKANNTTEAVKKRTLIF